MTTPAVTVKFICGARTLDLTSGRYQVADSFAPPATKLVPLMAGGTSANRYGGAVRVGQSAANRSWSFPVHIVDCESPSEVTRALADLAYFLSLAGDEAEPLYLFFKPDADIAAAPTWGQSGVYYEIAHGEVPQPTTSGTWQHLNGIASFSVNVSCSIKPYARGQRQRLMSGVGGLLEDRIGTVDGQSRGLQVPPACTNKMTNPVFGHATPANGWSIGGDLLSSVVTDPALLPGPDYRAALELTRVTTPNNAAVQTINAGNTNAHTLSCLARRRDGEAVTSSDAAMFYGSSQTTTYRSLGQGWYRLTAAVTGVASNTATGIVIAGNGRNVIVTGFQLEETSFATPPAWGDLLGCAWTGTAHASTTTRTAARARLPVAGHLSAIEGHIRLVWETELASTHGVNLRLLTNDDTEFRFFYTQATDVFTFIVDGTSATTAGQTFAAGDRFVFDLVWSRAGGLVLYINGASAATAAYSVPTLGTYLYLGTDASGATHGQGTFLGLDIWDQPATAAEVLADYNNIAPLVADGQRVSAIPCLWTKDGDDTVDNADNSTQDNFCVVLGVPGSAPAVTRLTCESGSIGSACFSLVDAPHFMRPSAWSFSDHSGTVDAGASGGERDDTTIDTTGDAVGSLSDTIGAAWPIVAGREMIAWVRLYDEGEALTLRLEIDDPFDTETEYRAVTTAAAYRLVRTPPLVIPATFFPAESAGNSFSVTVHGKRTSGSDVVRSDYTALFFRPMQIIQNWATAVGSAAAIEGRVAMQLSYPATSPTEFIGLANLIGDVIEFAPGAYNILLCLLDVERAVDPLTTRTLVYANVQVTPRYALL